jgi:hypothetical protein
LLRDPDSAVFSDVFFVNDRKSATGYYMPVVCGSVIAMTMDVYGHLFDPGDDGTELAEAERNPIG